MRLFCSMPLRGAGATFGPQSRLRQFSFFLVARSGKLGYKTVCPNNKTYVLKS